MKRGWIICGGILWLLLAAELRAQPVLNRVEQLLRDQIGAFRQSGQASAEPGYLGLVADDMQQGGGVRVVDIMPSGPAARAGVQKGDQITAINGTPIRTMDDMARALDGKTEGARLTLAVSRSGTAQELQVMLGRRPDARPASRVANELPGPSLGPAGGDVPRGPRLGIRALAVTDEVRAANQLPDAEGAVVNGVTAGSAADRAGIPMGAVIRSVDGRKIAGPEDLAAVIRGTSGNRIEVTYVFRGEEKRQPVMLAVASPPTDAPKLELRGRPTSPPAAKSELPAPAVPSDARVSTLEERIRALEERVEKLEAAAARAPE